MNYKFGNKNNWRRWAWNRISERLAGQPHEARVLYLPGPEDLDRPEALRRGFSGLNMIGVERDPNVLTNLRKAGRLCVDGDFLPVAETLSLRHRLDVVMGDLVCGLEAPMMLRLFDLMFLPNLSRTTFVFNLQRGRDSSSNEWKSAIAENIEAIDAGDQLRSFEKHRGYLLHHYLVGMFIALAESNCAKTGTTAPTRDALFNTLWRTGEPAFFSYRSARVTMDSVAFRNPTGTLVDSQFRSGIEQLFRRRRDRSTTQRVAAILATRTSRLKAARRASAYPSPGPFTALS